MPADTKNRHFFRVCQTNIRGVGRIWILAVRQWWLWHYKQRTMNSRVHFCTVLALALIHSVPVRPETMKRVYTAPGGLNFEVTQGGLSQINSSLLMDVFPPNMCYVPGMKIGWSIRKINSNREAACAPLIARMMIFFEAL